MVDQDTSTIHVMGGSNKYGQIWSSTEKLKFDGHNETWEISSDLTEPLTKSVAVSSKSNEFIGYLVGGYNIQSGRDRNGRERGVSKIWGLQRSNIKWVELSKRLKTHHHSHTVVNVNSNDFSCN